MPDVNLIIDGHAVTVPAGTNLVDAARTVEVAIPVFCYHPKLKPVGMCRMCLIEVYTPRIDPATRQVVLGPDGLPQLALMMNKLQPACVTPVSEGMVVKTTTEKVKFAQRGVLEFLLTSHPLDCPVCDKGGECPLQNLTMQWGPEVSRFDYSDKVHFEKPIKLSDVIYLDRERCILCSRCVRFQDDIAGDSVLGFDNRGRSWEIISKSEPGFDSKFSGNTTDICPVGALTNADFRFRSRVWEVRSTPSICTHCSVGCNLSLDARHNKLMRVMPRENDDVNEIWLCDKGRMGMRFVESAARVTTPLVRQHGKLVPASWDEALTRIASNLSQIAAKGTGQVAGLVSDSASNEDLYAFRKLITETYQSTSLDHRPGASTDVALDDAPLTAGVGKGTSLLTLGKGTTVIVLAADVEEEAPLYVLRLRGIQNRGGAVHVVNAFATKLGRDASSDTRINPGSEAAYTQAFLKLVLAAQAASGFDRRVRNLDDVRNQLNKLSVDTLLEQAGATHAQLQKLVDAYMSATNAIIVYGRTAQQVGVSVTQTLANAAIATGKCGKPNNGLIALTAGANTTGALALGVRPGKDGAAANEFWARAEAGTLRGLLVVGLDPANNNPAAAEGLATIAKHGFLAVQTMFMNTTAELADVVLPQMAISETDGTLTNAERRVQRFRTAVAAPSAMHPTWQICAYLAERSTVAVPASKNATAVLGDWEYAVTSDVTEEVAQRIPRFGGITYTSLDLSINSWGRQANDSVYYDGTSYTNTEGNGVQIAALADDPTAPLPLTYTAAVAFEPKGEFGLLLQTPVRAYNGGSWSTDSKLSTVQVPVHVLISPTDAARWNINAGDKVTISTPVGTSTIPAQIDKNVAAGQVLMPDVAGAPLHLALGAYTRVAIRRAE